MGRLTIVVLAGALTGCVSDPPPPYQKSFSEMTPAERCVEYSNLMNNGYASPTDKAMLFEKAKNEGCMGNPRPQTVIVR